MEEADGEGSVPHLVCIQGWGGGGVVAERWGGAAAEEVIL